MTAYIKGNPLLGEALLLFVLLLFVIFILVSKLRCVVNILGKGYLLDLVSEEWREEEEEGGRGERGREEEEGRREGRIRGRRKGGRVRRG